VLLARAIGEADELHESRLVRQQDPPAHPLSQGSRVTAVNGYRHLADSHWPGVMQHAD
jgi:hypothetical protein